MTASPTPRRRRTEAEIAQGRHDIASRKIEHLTKQRDRLAAEATAVGGQLAEQTKIRDFYAGHPGVTTDRIADDPAQLTIPDDEPDGSA